jgi:hypothetical protein
MNLRARRTLIGFAAALLSITFVSACASARSDTRGITSAPRPIFHAPPLGGHVPPTADVAADRDELIGVLDSLHVRFDLAERSASRGARFVAIGAIVTAAIGASSPVFTSHEPTERKISQAGAAATGILAALATELQLSRKSEAQRNCKTAIYNALADVRIKYSSLSLPTTDEAWHDYLLFKDGIDRSIRSNCP